MSLFAADTVLNIRIDGPAGEGPGITDHNAILSGLTLEKLSDPVLAMMRVTKIGLNLTLHFVGRPNIGYAIDFSTDLIVWTQLTDAATPDATCSGTFTDGVPARTGALGGYYRVRDKTVQPVP